MRVELDDFISFARAGVGYVEGDADFRAVDSRVNPVATARGTDTPPLRSDLEIAIGECGVTQPVTEKVERTVDAGPLAFPLRVRFGGQVVGTFADGLRKCDGEFAAGIVIAEKHVGDRRPALRAREPCFDNSRNVFVHPVNAHRTAVQQHDTNTLAYALHLLYPIS